MRLSKGIEKIENKTIDAINAINLKRILIAKKLKEYAAKPSTKKRVRNLVIGGALVGILVSQKGCKLNKDSDIITTNDNDNIDKIMEEAQKEIGPHLSFDPNSEQELINRIADVYVDAAAKGLGDLTIEQWMDWYTVTNIDDISPIEYYRLLDDTKTATTIMENYDFVNNALLEDAITVTPDTIINIDNLVADTKSANELADFQKLLATYNVASADTQKETADSINEYLYNEFVTNKHDTVTASSNLTRMKLLLATWELTNNHSWTVPSKDIANIMYPSNGVNCDLASETTGISVWNDQKTVVRKTLEEKMEMMIQLMLQEDKSQQDVRVALRSLEIEMAIQDLVNEKGLVKIDNPSSEQAIIDSKPQTSKGKTITKEQEKHIVTNPKTGKKEVHLPANGEVTPNKDLLEDVRKKNQNEELRVKGVQEGAQAGNENGYQDGSENKKFNDTPRIDLSKSDKIYADAYRSNYKKYYAEGYNEGKKLAEGPINRKEEIIPDKEANKELEAMMIKSGKENGFAAGDTKGYQDGYSGNKYNDGVNVNHDDKNYINAYIEEYKKSYKNAYNEGEKVRLEIEKQSKPTEKPTEKPNDTKIKEEIELLPGYYEKDGKIYDENGNEVEIIVGSNETNRNLAALKTLRSVLSDSMNNANEVELGKTKFI